MSLFVALPISHHSGNSFGLLSTLPPEDLPTRPGSAPQQRRLIKRRRARGRGRPHQRTALRRRQADEMDAELSAFFNTTLEQEEQKQADPQKSRWFNLRRPEQGSQQPNLHHSKLQAQCPPKASDEQHRLGSPATGLQVPHDVSPMDYALVKWQPSNWPETPSCQSDCTTPQSLIDLQPSWGKLQWPNLEPMQDD